MQIDYGFRIEQVLEKVNQELKPRGLEFVDDGKEHAGMMIYELINRVKPPSQTSKGDSNGGSRD